MTTDNLDFDEERGSLEPLELLELIEKRALRTVGLVATASAQEIRIEFALLAREIARARLQLVDAQSSEQGETGRSH